MLICIQLGLAIHKCLSASPASILAYLWHDLFLLALSTTLLYFTYFSKPIQIYLHKPVHLLSTLLFLGYLSHLLLILKHTKTTCSSSPRFLAMQTLLDSYESIMILLLWITKVAQTRSGRKERCVVRRWPGWPKAEKKRAPLAPNSQSHSRVILDLRLCRRAAHENRIRWSEILATLRNFSSLRAFLSLRLEHWTLSSAWQISQILRRTLFTLLIGKRVALIQ